MANPEHLAILKQGVEVWNKWRDETSGIKIDLNYTDLRGVELSRANLYGANLRQANLHGANLRQANLSVVDLYGANLREANLREADLIKANLSCAYLNVANLSEANLSWANLNLANLSGADLSGADLSGANLREANLREANLREANLSDANLNSADFHNATLTGSCIRDWLLNSLTNLDEVICEYVYLDDEKTEIRPINGNFDPGEFASLYKKIIETTDLILSKTSQNDNNINNQGVKFYSTQTTKIERPQRTQSDTNINNQGVQFYSNSTIHTWENLRFRSKTEIKIAEALDRTGVLFVPNSLARLNTAKGRENKEADFLICYNGKWGVLEVDGPFHTAERRVEEQERERIFKKNGIKVVERFDSERCYNHPDEVVQEFFKMIEIGYS